MNIQLKSLLLALLMPGLSSTLKAMEQPEPASLGNMSAEIKQEIIKALIKVSGSKEQAIEVLKKLRLVNKDLKTLINDKPVIAKFAESFNVSLQDAAHKMLTVAPIPAREIVESWKEKIVTLLRTDSAFDRIADIDIHDFVQLPGIKKDILVVGKDRFYGRFFVVSITELGQIHGRLFGEISKHYSISAQDSEDVSHVKVKIFTALFPNTPIQNLFVASFENMPINCKVKIDHFDESVEAVYIKLQHPITKQGPLIKIFNNGQFVWPDMFV